MRVHRGAGPDGGEPDWMRRLLVSIALLALLAGGVAPAAGGTADAWEPTPHGWRSGPIEHVGFLPLDTTGVGGTVNAKTLYVTSWKALSIYDVSEPESPQILSVTPLGPQLINEHPSTNGKILLLSDDVPDRTLQVWDVSDPAAPEQLSTLTTTATEHIWTCVLDCEWAYGSAGSIVDLRDPTKPAVVANWRAQFSARSTHTIQEVAPGKILTGSLPGRYLDATVDPTKPTLLATFDPPATKPSGTAESPPSHIGWPHEARSRFALSGLETPFSGACDDQSGQFVSYDTAGWEETGTFTVAGKFQITQNGTYPDGLAPANAVGCSPIGFDAHPDFDQRRLAAVAWFEHGVRLLNVAEDGKITESGGFIAHGTEAFMPVWVGGKHLYVIDTARGIDIFRVSEVST